MCGQLPNVVGLIFGVLQIALYAMYRKNKPVKQDDQKLPEHKGDITVNNENVVVPIVTDEKQEVIKTDEPGDIEIGEKKEEKNHDQAELNNKKTEEKERESCQV